jgi:hypothetical protein
MADTWECFECKKVSDKKKVAFSVLNKQMCSTKCCKTFREKEEEKKPKYETLSYYKPDIHCWNH